MSMVGMKIIYAEDTGTTVPAFPPIPMTTDAFNALLDGGTLPVYRCDETDQCLRPTRADITIPAETSFRSRVETLLGSITEKARTRTALTQEEIDAAITKKMLRKLQCKVSVVNSFNDGLSLLEQEAFDAFISESHVDGVDLKELIEKAKLINQPHHKNDYIIPVLGLSSHEIDAEETHCLASGMDYYIESPVDIDDLQAILRRWMGRAEYMAENRHENDLLPPGVVN